MLTLRVVVVAVVALAACEKKPENVEIDFQSLDGKIGTEIEKIFAHPAVDSGMDAFVDSLGGNPALLASGGKLLASLGADPKVSAQVEGLINDIASAPRMQQLALQIAAANPGEPVEDLVGKRIESAWGNPALSKALEADFQELIGKVQLGPDVAALGAKLEAKLTHVVEDPARMARWGKRLTELNNGSVPGRARATELYAEHAWSDAHVEAFLTALLKDQTLRDETAAAVADLIALRPIAKELTETTLQVVSDPALRKAAVDLMLELLEAQPKVATVTKLQRQIVLDPKIVGLVQRVAHQLFTDPQVAHVVGLHVDRLTANPKLQALFDDFLDHW